MKEESIVLEESGISSKRAYLIVKRFFDVVLSLLALIILSPILLVVGILVKIDSKGPIILKQNRIGKDGKEFTFYKFRSMVVNADEILYEMLKEDNELSREYKRNKKFSCDPRITRVGKVIRKLSFDELPQLVNILKGDMSIVGPRPYLPREKEDMGSYYEEIIKMIPGLTGYWQVNGRSETSFKGRLKLDCEYLKIRGLKTDISIIFKTVGVVLKHKGAK